jgi:hypothetical protein
MRRSGRGVCEVIAPNPRISVRLWPQPDRSTLLAIPLGQSDRDSARRAVQLSTSSLADLSADNGPKRDPKGMPLSSRNPPLFLEGPTDNVTPGYCLPPDRTHCCQRYPADTRVVGSRHIGASGHNPQHPENDLPLLDRQPIAWCAHRETSSHPSLLLVLHGCACNRRLAIAEIGERSGKGLVKCETLSWGKEPRLAAGGGTS